MNPYHGEKCGCRCSEGNEPTGAGDTPVSVPRSTPAPVPPELWPTPWTCEPWMDEHQVIAANGALVLENMPKRLGDFIVAKVNETREQQ